MTSLSWHLIAAPRNAATRFLVFGALLLPPVVLSLFRYREPWFGYVVVAYPALGVLHLLLLSDIQRRLREMIRVSQDLVDPSVSGPIGDASGTGWRTGWSLAAAMLVGAVLSGISLRFSVNPHASRLADALAVFYLGFMTGEVAALAATVPMHFHGLLGMRLRLNPFDAANTAEIRALADISLGLGLTITGAIFLMNMVLAAAAYYFRHLLVGVGIVSAAAWVFILILTVYPHLVLNRVVSRAQTESVRVLDTQLRAVFERLVREDDVAERVDLLLKVHQQIAGNRKSAISNTFLFGVLSSMAVNVLPTVVGWLPVAEAVKRVLGWV